MKFLSLLLFCFPLFSTALEGLYYQLYTDAYIAQHLQANLSCVTAIFDDRGFYVFNGYRMHTSTISKYKGQFVPTLDKENCFDMKPSVHKNTTNQICLFPVDAQGHYIVASNGNFQRTFILTQYQPNASWPSLDDPDFVMVNQTLQTYHLPNNLVRTNHSSCFFYPPKDLDYILKKPNA